MLSEQSVAIIGNFVWQSEGSQQASLISYTGLLIKDEQGDFKIRLEDENFIAYLACEG